MNPLRQFLNGRDRTHAGVLSLTVANPFVIRACMEYAKEKSMFFMVEATVNQVNQFGGYTGMHPKDFAGMIEKSASEIGLDVSNVMLCGDHLGPFSWQNLDEKEAMERSRELVRQYVQAGFRKIHLDTSMRLADDPKDRPLDIEISTRRAVELARISEDTYAATKEQSPWRYRPVYVIGSEVPVPGGTEHDEVMQITKSDDLRTTIESYRDALIRSGLEVVWNNIVAIVAQIGVEFSDTNVCDYDHNKAIELSAELGRHPGLVFESHSSDYQLPENLRKMVNDGVGILKVGPELTFAYREGLFALERIESDMLASTNLKPSRFSDVLEEAMCKSEPNYWIKYYHGTPHEQKIKRQYSYSDRSRYYFAQPSVVAAVEHLLDNLGHMDIPMTVISQYMPVQYQRIRQGKLKNNAVDLLKDKVICVVERYRSALLESCLSR